MKLNLGCGLNKKDGWLNVDINKKCKPDKVIDIEKRFPFKDNTIDGVLAERILEHVSDLPFVMGEIWRVCKSRAIVEIIVPSHRTEGAYADPTHKRFFTLGTFDYFTKKRRSSYYFDSEYEIIEKKVLNVGILRKTLAKLGISHFLWNTEGEYYIKLSVVK